jgi:prepilin signal peptidase PulO-like enzyme (type II secretory pathway)
VVAAGPQAHTKAGQEAHYLSEATQPSRLEGATQTKYGISTTSAGHAPRPATHVARTPWPPLHCHSCEHPGKLKCHIFPASGQTALLCSCRVSTAFFLFLLCPTPLSIGYASVCPGSLAETLTCTLLVTMACRGCRNIHLKVTFPCPSNTCPGSILH